MIKITHPNLSKLALRHYESLEKKIESARSKIDRLAAQNKRIKIIFGDAYNFRRIVLANPAEIEKLIEKWVDSKEYKIKERFNYYHKTLYENFSSQKEVLVEDTLISRAMKLVHDLNMVVCPYCNRNFINNTDKKGKRTCDIDHFFPKKVFPFLAISFYNLIPSCKWCNFTKKDKANTEPENYLINPYDTRDEFIFDAKFIVRFLNSKFYYKADALEIEFKEHLAPRVAKHIETFDLEDLYKKHKDYALELIQKKYAYSESYIDNLFQQYEGTLFKNREDILRLVTSNFVEEEDLSKRPLSKLTMDIVRQLDL